MQNTSPLFYYGKSFKGKTASKKSRGWNTCHRTLVRFLSLGLEPFYAVLLWRIPPFQNKGPATLLTEPLYNKAFMENPALLKHGFVLFALRQTLKESFFCHSLNLTHLSRNHLYYCSNNLRKKAFSLKANPWIPQVLTVLLLLLFLQCSSMFYSSLFLFDGFLSTDSLESPTLGNPYSTKVSGKPTRVPHKGARNSQNRNKPKQEHESSQMNHQSLTQEKKRTVIQTPIGMHMNESGAHLEYFILLVVLLFYSMVQIPVGTGTVLRIPYPTVGHALEPIQNKGP